MPQYSATWVGDGKGIRFRTPVAPLDRPPGGIMFALIMSAAAIAAAIAAVVYTKQRSERAAMRFQNEHKEQVELLVEEVKECRDALKVMAASISRLDKDDDRLDDLSQSRTERVESMAEELENLNDRVAQITRQLNQNLGPHRR
jgi:predicted nuclease with TOPRIM domain